MDFQYEQIQYKEGLPVNIFTHMIERFPYHWHEDPELLFVLEGELEVRIDEISHYLKAGEMFFINSNELHFTNSKSHFGRTQVLALQLDRNYLKRKNINVRERRFFIDAQTGKREAVQRTKSILAEMLDLMVNQKHFYQLKIEKNVMELLLLLQENFETEFVPGPEAEIEDRRLLEILKFMYENCTNTNLNIESIAEAFSLSPSYLSRYFKARAGVPLKKKLDTMRLDKSLHTLLTTNKSITDIVMEFGFPDLKSYYRVFKQQIGMTPGEYREKYTHEQQDAVPKDYLSVNTTAMLANVFQQAEPDTQTLMKEVKESYRIDSSASYGNIKPTYLSLASIGYASHALRRDVTAQLQQVQKDIGFQYLRFHDIFSDRLHIYNERPDGSCYFNFSHIDELLDNILAAKMRPFIEIGFMPEQLASGPETIFEGDAFISPPHSTEKWQQLLDTFIRHLISRYGLQEVRNWYFEFWNEPEVPYFWAGTREAFFRLYKASYQTIKAIDQELKIGGFGLIDPSGGGGWMEDFNKYALAEGIDLDFFSFHVYNLAIQPKKMEKTNYREAEQFHDIQSLLRETAVIGDKFHVTKIIERMTEKAASIPAFHKDIWITEWNANNDHKDLLHDTCYMAPFIIRNVLANYKKVQGMGYWTLTDVFEEFRKEQPLFHGGFGLTTYNGIKKPSYHAFSFLSKLKGEVVAEEEELIVTKTEDKLFILVCNYCHPNKLYSTFDYSQLTHTNRSNVFEPVKKKVDIELTGWKGNFRKRVHRVNQEHGSSFDAWVACGSPEVIDSEIHRYLAAKAEPELTEETVVLSGNDPFSFSMQPHEIQLIEFTKDYRQEFLTE